MNRIVEETALPTTTSDPDVEPTYIEGKPLSPRLDRIEYEYDDEPSIDHVLDQQSVRSIGTLDDDDTMSIARTFGVRSRADNSLRQYSSFDSSLRQKVPIPASPNTASNVLPPTVPPKSPNRHTADHLTFDEFQAGPSTRPRPVSMMMPTEPEERAESSNSRYAGTFNARSESTHESETPRSTTPASSFYAKPKRKMGHVNTRGSSLLDLSTGGDESIHPPPRSSIPRSSDEGFDSSQSNSTGSHSLRSHMSVPVDANLRSMPGVVGIGEGWAGGPQGQDKKRRLWFRRKSSKKQEEDPLALWSIQESDPVLVPLNGKGGQKKGVFKEAWNRSIGRFGSTPALLSGDQVNTSRGAKSGGIKEFFSRSRLDLAEEKTTKRPEDLKAQEKKEKRRTVAFFGSSKSQVELSTPRARPMSTVPTATPHSPPSPSPAPRITTPLGINQETTPLPPLKIPDHSRRLLGAPLSAPAAPGGLPPPWRPVSFIIPRPLGSPAPRSFSRNEDQAIVEEPENIYPDHQTPTLSTPGIDGLHQSISSAGVETPRTNSAEGRSLHHKRSTRIFEDESEMEIPRPKSSLARSSYTATPLNVSTPGLDTLQDWAQEGKRPMSRAFRPAQDAPPKFPERSQTSNWAPTSFINRIKQAFTTSNESTGRGKDLPELPSRTSTPIMPGAYPDSRPVSSMGMIKDDPLSPSPYDITKAVAREMLATPSPTRPSSRASVRKRGLSGDLWPKLTKIKEGGDPAVGQGGNHTRPTSRMEKRNSYATLAGRFGFGRNSSFGPEQTLSVSTTELNRTQTDLDAPTASPSPITPLVVRDFGEDDLGLDDILDATRRMTLVRDLEAALPLPPARDEPLSPETVASSPRTLSSSEATVMAASPTTNDEDRGHRNHPSTSTAATFDLDELMTPADIRKSFERTVGGRRGSTHSDKLSFDGEGNVVEKTYTRQHWPTRKHTRNTSIGELASELMNTAVNRSRTSLTLKPPADYPAKQRGPIDEGDAEDEMRLREREERAMSFASQMSDMSSTLSMEEEAVQMSAIRVASVQQQVKFRQMELGSEIKL